ALWNVGGPAAVFEITCPPHATTFGKRAANFSFRRINHSWPSSSVAYAVSTRSRIPPAMAGMLSRGSADFNGPAPARPTGFSHRRAAAAGAGLPRAALAPPWRSGHPGAAALPVDERGDDELATVAGACLRR